MSYYVLSEDDDGGVRLEGARLNESEAIRLFKTTAHRLGCTRGDDFTALHPEKPWSVQLLSHS